MRRPPIDIDWQKAIRWSGTMSAEVLIASISSPGNGGPALKRMTDTSRPLTVKSSA